MNFGLPICHRSLSVPLRPEIEGMELDNVQFVKLYQNARDVIEKLKDTSVKKVAVVGAGYIGVELAEAFKRNGREVVLIDLADTCLSGYYDREFSDRMAHNLQEHGVKLAFGEKVVRLEGKRRVERVVTDQGCYEADMVVFGIGFRPNTSLGQGRLRTFGNGAFLAGMLLEIKGEFPALHEKVTYHNYEFEVLEMDSRRILKVKFTILPKEMDESESKE